MVRCQSMMRLRVLIAPRAPTRHQRGNLAHILRMIDQTTAEYRTSISV